MKIYRYRFPYLILSLLIMIMMESCSGCSHRSRRGRERQRERVERREARTERSDSRSSRRSDSQGRRSSSRTYTEEQIASITEGEDYDAMLDCMFAKINELTSLKNEYFRGDMPDKQVKTRMKEIEEKYAPIEQALDKAQEEGELTYNQHKRQMKLIGDYMNVANSVFNRLGDDLSSVMDM